MINCFLYSVRRSLKLAMMLGALSGCGQGNRSELDILPNTDKARAALEKALSAWKDGHQPGKIQTNSPSIEVVDRVWRGGAKLASYEIAEAADKPGPRWFAVKLTLKDSPQPRQVYYAVLGIDPLWVYREEDFQQALGMGN